MPIRQQKLAPARICGISKIMQHSPNPSHTIGLSLNMNDNTAAYECNKN